MAPDLEQRAEELMYEVFEMEEAVENIENEAFDGMLDYFDYDTDYDFSDRDEDYEYFDQGGK